MKELDLVRDVLDKQLVDEEENEMGRVDGIVIDVADDGPPRVDHLELGFVVLAERLHWRFANLAEWLRRWSVRKTERQHVAWTKVVDVNRHHVKVSVRVEDTPAFDWERWLRDHVVTKIPGSREQ